VPADHGGFALGSAADEQFIGIGLSATGLRDPCDAGLGLSTLYYTVDRRGGDCPARRGPYT
jgi:hypothetical protein